MNIIKDKIIYSSLEPKPVQHTKPYIERILAEVHQELEETGDRDWLVDTENGLSRKISQVEPVSKNVARALHNLGFRAGDVLQTGYSSCLDFYWPVLGAWLCGGAVSLGDPGLSQEAIKQQIQDTGAKVVVCNRLHLDKYCRVTQELEKEGNVIKLFVLDAHINDILPTGVECFQTLLEYDGDIFALAKLDYIPDSVAIIPWSSGSTGNPKGILYSHRTLQAFSVDKAISSKKALTSQVLFHIGGFSAVLSMGLFGGTVCHFIKEICFSAEDWFKTVEQFQPERVYCGVSQFIEISNAENTSSRDLNSVKLIIPVGGAVAKECSQRVVCLLGEQTKLVEVYGSTEMNFLAVKYNPQSDKFGQIGILGAGAQLYIQDIKTREKLGPGRKGKIMAKTENMMIKYLNRDEDNAEFFESDGFGYIGDVGYYDEAGNIFFSYRMKEVLKVDNFWFGPEEIENLLEKNEDVQEACAWGEYDVETGNDQVNLYLRQIYLLYDINKIWK